MVSTAQFDRSNSNDGVKKERRSQKERATTYVVENTAQPVKKYCFWGSGAKEYRTDWLSAPKKELTLVNMKIPLGKRREGF
ncbi:unnamed protein product [Onchocerca flexuosa]|uniref:Uncharacterized protein n=1 Tax=Onchocerca flexuosa TaxID=387005 RepID=A0A183HBY5_9BILA|nr:unnamed protein product [Onchocerca flexuosa]